MASFAAFVGLHLAVRNGGIPHQPDPDTPGVPEEPGEPTIPDQPPPSPVA